LPQQQELQIPAAAVVGMVILLWALLAVQAS